jgi:hypothetical protein
MNELELKIRKLHPYDEPGFPVDAWIDRFREVFGRTEAGGRVLSFLASYWHFLDRSLLTEEQRIQRQCFMDLLICCGMLAQDTGDQVMDRLLAVLIDIRTTRRDIPKEGTQNAG